jgi:hypothetical protein
MRHGKDALLWAVLATVAPLFTPAPTCAQGTGGPSVRDSNVGYIDNAIPGDQFRLRFDTSYNDRRPNLAEFFWAQGRPSGPGVPLPEKRVDFQDLTGYLELSLNERFSGFVEVPWRFVNPEVNANTNGVGDMNVGFKWAFAYSNDGVATLQFRSYAPTGDASRGLGTNHVTLEPALLVYQPLADRLGFEGEFRYWIPVGGTDFAGDIFRYGLGLHYELWQTSRWKVVPVLELVGWTVLDGKESFVHPSGLVTAEDAAGDTILDIKLGAHVKFGNSCDIYAGYGRPLTGNRWYENIVRVEFRWFF